MDVRRDRKVACSDSKVACSESKAAHNEVRARKDDRVHNENRACNEDRVHNENRARNEDNVHNEIRAWESGHSRLRSAALQLGQYTHTHGRLRSAAGDCRDAGQGRVAATICLSQQLQQPQ